MSREYTDASAMMEGKMCQVKNARAINVTACVVMRTWPEVDLRMLYECCSVTHAITEVLIETPNWLATEHPTDSLL